MISHSDLSHILKHTETIWPLLKNSRIFITGGTGFVGKWLLESFIAANEYFSLNSHIVVLTRKPDDFINRHPTIANHESITFHQGDIRNFEFPTGVFTHLIHGATEVKTKDSSLFVYDVIAEGTRHVLNFCREKNIKDILFISSGAVYDHELNHLKNKETSSSREIHHVPNTAYAQGKITAEWFANIYNIEYGLKCRIARCFAFIGPYLDLNGEYAVGNFIKNLIQDEDIQIKGDGTSIRSYLYAADMVIWLWTILVCGKPGIAYNVGSEEEINIHQLALKIASLKTPSPHVQILSPDYKKTISDRYVPCIKFTHQELGLYQKISLDDSLLKMFEWAKTYVKNKLLC